MLLFNNGFHRTVLHGANLFYQWCLFDLVNR